VCKGLFAVEAAYRRLPIPPFWHPVIGGLGFALIGIAQPRILGVGYGVIAAELAGSIAGGTLLVLGVAKLVAWWIALGSGTSGGTLAPLLFIGGAFGGSIAWLAGRAGLHADPRVYALVAMAAVFGASTRAVLTGIVFMLELSAAPTMAVPLMLATGIAALVATLLASDSLMTEKLTRRGLRIRHHAEVDVLHQTPVSAVMTRDVVTLDASMSVGEARKAVAAGSHGAFPIVRDEELVGIVSRTDLLADDVRDSSSVIDAGRTDVVSVGATAPVLEVVETIVRENVEHVPVLDEGRLVGICTRTDVLRARARQLEDERVPSR
jgi:CBS domain-containing protein